MSEENYLLTNKHILLAPSGHFDNLSDELQEEIQYIINNFCGKVITNVDDFIIQDNSVILYIAGEVDRIIPHIAHIGKVLIIKELSTYNREEHDFISIGEVPININNMGVYFRKVFPDDTNFFSDVKNAHNFQCLTETNKAGTAMRTGIYLSNVDKCENCLKFNLLRCSTNFEGPTDNFKQVDNQIINKANCLASNMFSYNAKLNHVLAQIYNNSVVKKRGGKKAEKKAVIKAHSDKTKDMPSNGLICFTTFYDNNPTGNVEVGLFDIKYKQHSIFTRLVFHLKKKEQHPNLLSEFEVVLYPNSMFMIPLSCNMLYTHEIRPSALPVNMIPTRLGYVIRCSKTKAVHKNGETFIEHEDGSLTKLIPMNSDYSKLIKQLYFEENVETYPIKYPLIPTSFNLGDFKAPIY